MKKLAFILLLQLTMTLLAAEISQPFIEYERDYAYDAEVIKLQVIVPGATDADRTEIVLNLLDGKAAIYKEQTWVSSSYDVVTNETAESIKQDFTVIPSEQGTVLLQASAQDFHLGSDLLLSETLGLSVEKQPESTSRNIFKLHLLQDQLYAGESGILFVEVFTRDKLQNLDTIHINPGNFKMRYFRPQKRRLISLQGDQGYLYTLPIEVSSTAIGSGSLPGQELDFEFMNGNTRYTETLAAGPVNYVIQEISGIGGNRGNVLIGSDLKMEILNYPEDALNGEEFSFSFRISGDGNLDELESLMPYGKFPSFLEEKKSNSSFKLEKGHLRYSAVFEYSGQSRSIFGYDWKELRIPFFNSLSGEMEELQFELEPIAGNVDMTKFWSLLSAVLISALVAALLIWGTFIYIKKARRQSEDNSEVPLFADEKVSLLMFVEEYSLTIREKEILEILVRGKSTKDIAGQLYISPETARKHIRNIMKKTETHSRYEIYVLLSSFIKEMPGNNRKE